MRNNEHSQMIRSRFQYW